MMYTLINWNYWNDWIHFYSLVVDAMSGRGTFNDNIRHQQIDNHMNM